MSLLNHPDFQLLLHHFNQDKREKSARQCELSDEDLAYCFPTLVSHNYFKENPSYIYLKMSTLAKEEMAHSNNVYNAPKTILEKLDQNAKKVLVDTKYDAEVDNLNNKLHQACFIRELSPQPQSFFKVGRKDQRSSTGVIFIK